MVRGMIPRHRCGLAQQTPVLSTLTVDAYNPGLDKTGARSRVRATLEIGIGEPRMNAGVPSLPYR